jgi:nucleoid DNA-binding protein
MKKSEFVEALQTRAAARGRTLSKAVIDDVLIIQAELVKELLRAKGEAKVPELCTLKVQPRASRRLIHPTTKKETVIPARKVVAVKPAKNISRVAG